MKKSHCCLDAKADIGDSSTTPWRDMRAVALTTSFSLLWFVRAVADLQLRADSRHTHCASF